jgi:hypothetical protein
MFALRAMVVLLAGLSSAHRAFCPASFAIASFIWRSAVLNPAHCAATARTARPFASTTFDTVGDDPGRQAVPLSEIMAILGHAQIQTTMACVHSLAETRRQATAKIDDVLRGRGGA